MDVLLANWFAALLFAVFTLIAMGTTVSMFFSGDRDAKIGSLIPLVLAAAFAAGFIFSSTHFVVEPNTTALIVDRSTGSTVGAMLTPGVHAKSWLQIKYVYPGQKNYVWCPQVTPSVKGGAEVVVTVCFTFDASAVNWQSQFLAYNGDDKVVFDGWLSENVQTSIASSIAAFVPQQLTDNRIAVENTISTNLLAWFAEKGVNLRMVALRNWQFTSPDMKAAYEAAQVSIAQIEKANNEQAAAKIQAVTASMRAESCSAAGFTNEQYCLGFLQLQWLQGLPSLPNNFVLSLGGNTPAVTFPAAPAPVSAP
jgi:hypothetical protein